MGPYRQVQERNKTHQYPKSDDRFSSFFSTPKFIDDLTALSKNVVRGSGDKEGVLKNGLIDIKDGLPASVYIPFVAGSNRNYAVLNIVESETRLFLTKTRAPFMVCVEVYRPEELKLWARENLRAKRTSEEDYYNLKDTWARLKERVRKSKKTKAQKLISISDEKLSYPLTIKYYKH